VYPSCAQRGTYRHLRDGRRVLAWEVRTAKHLFELTYLCDVSLSSMIQDDVVVLLDTRDPGHKATCQKYQHQGIHPVLYTQRTEISQLLKQKPPPVRGPPRAKSGPAAGRRLEKPSIVSPLKSPSTSSKRVVPRLAAPIASTFAVGDARPAWPLEPVIELVSQTLKWEGSAIEVDSPVPAVNPTIRTLRTLQAWLDGLSSDDVVRLSKLSSIHRRFADRTTSIAPPPTMTAEGEERRQAFATFHTLSKAWAQPITPMFQRMYCGAAPHAYHAASFIMKWTEKEKKDAKKEFMQGIEGASQRRLRGKHFDSLNDSETPFDSMCYSIPDSEAGLCSQQRSSTNLGPLQTRSWAPDSGHHWQTPYFGDGDPYLSS
jgi:hypothetical protein